MAEQANQPERRRPAMILPMEAIMGGEEIEKVTSPLDEEGKSEAQESAKEKDSGEQNVIEEKVDTATNPYYEKYMEQVSLGILPLHESVTTDEGEILVSDYLTDDESYKLFISECKKELESGLLTGKVDVTGLDQFYVDIIETISKGGDIKEVFKLYQLNQDVVKTINIDTPEGQSAAIVAYYRIIGTPDKAIQAMLQGYHAAGTLTEEAHECYEKLIEHQNKAAEEQKKKADDAAKEAQAKYKKLKADTRATLRERGIPESKAKLLTDKYLAIGQSGNYVIDDACYSRMSDANELSELILFIDNKEEYIKQYASKLINDEKLNIAKSIQQGQVALGSKTGGLTLSKAKASSVQKQVTVGEERQSASQSVKPVEPASGTVSGLIHINKEAIL